MKNFFGKYAGYNVSHSNSYIATAFAVVMTSLLVGGYEVTQAGSEAEIALAVSATQPLAIARMETIVVTAKRS